MRCPYFIRAGYRMKWDIHSTLILSVILLFLVYYYHQCQRRVTASTVTSAEDINYSSKPEEKRMKPRFAMMDAMGSSGNNDSNNLGLPTLTPMLPLEDVNPADSYDSKDMPTKQIPETLNLTGSPGNNNNYDSNDSLIPTTATPQTPHDVNFTEPEEILMKQIFETHKLTKSNDNIFFIETSCATNQRKSIGQGLILKPRQACAIYSTAYHNPSKHVILIVTCPLLHNFYDESPAIAKAVLDLPNFSVAHVNLTEMYAHSPLSAFLSGRLWQSAYPVEHNADLFRILVVYLFGGTYMDLDIVTTRSLDDLGINYIGAEVDDSVATGVFNFEDHHPYLKEYLSEAYEAYSPQEWTSIGPALATSVLRKFCDLTLQESSSLTRIGHISRCGITVLSDKIFYPISHWNWTLYMNNTAWPLIQLHLKRTYAVHVWNHKSAGTPIAVGSQQPYAKLAERHCFPVYSQCGQVF